MDEKASGHPSASSLSLDHRDEEYRIDAAAANSCGVVIPKISPHTAQDGLLIRVLSRFRTNDSVKDPGPPPDGGVHAWSQALLCHLVIFNTWGFINSFGLFQTYYAHALKEPPSSISWIGSVQIFAPFFIGAFSGRALDAGFFRLTFVTGVVIQLVGIFTTSLCKTYWSVFLAQGLCVGLGNGLVFVPSIALTGTYFLKNRSLALGIAASGSATGGLVYPAIAERLLPTIGFGWTVRVMGFVMMVTMTISAVFLKPRLPPRKSGPIVEWAAFTELPYALFAVAAFLLFWGLYVGFYYIGSYGRDTLGTSQATSINLLLTMNGVGIPGRLIPNYLADKKVGPLNAMIPFAVICSVLLYCWIAIDSVAGLWAFAIIYGSFAAGIQSLFPATLTSLTDDPKKAGMRVGMIFSVTGFAVLTGPPLAGALIQRGNGSYVGAQVFAASAMAAGFVALLAARWAKTGWRLRVRV